MNAWVPARRSHYKNERDSNINVELLFTHQEKEEETHHYDRKFYYIHWARDSFNSWRRGWKKLNGYWEKRGNQRTTKFVLIFPQLAQDDLKILKKNGCNIIFEKGAKEKYNIALEEGIKKFKIKIRYRESKMLVSWSKDFNRWFHTLFKTLTRYLAVRLEDDINADYIPVIKQIGEREFEIASWAMFRSNHFWRTARKEMERTNKPLFVLEMEEYIPPSKKEELVLDHKFSLRDYQQKALDKWRENHYFGTVQLPTGAGKTVIGIEAVHALQQRTLILVPNLALVDQWAEQLSSKLSYPVDKIGIFNGQKKQFSDRSVVVSTYQLLSQYLQDFHDYGSDDKREIKREKITVEDTIGFFTNEFGLLIADEAHHIQAQTFRYIAMDLKVPRRLALSATIEKSVHSSLVIATMGPIIYSVGYGLLARGGYIAPIYYKRIMIPLTVEEKEVIIKEGKKTSVMSKLSRNSRNKYRALLKLLQSDYCKQTLIFTSRVKHAKSIHSFLKENSITSTILTGDTVSTDAEQQKILEDFRKGDIHTLVLVKMLNEGFDAPADTVIVVSGTKNRREQIQRFGRATRPGKVAKLFELVIDPEEFEYEMDIAKERDVTDVIEPWVQESLLPPDIRKGLDKLIEDLFR
ncbi:MAG: DEAD/DEAH box helicase [Candidatus Hodarchaeales archaeon]